MELFALDDALLSLYEELQNRWVGCDWPTEFGAGGLNLCGITARQAALLARATSGQESADWDEAARWLTKVEADAEAARQAAALAWQEASAGQLEKAYSHARRACELERRYHRHAHWQAFEDTLHDCFEGTPCGFPSEPR